MTEEKQITEAKEAPIESSDAAWVTIDVALPPSQVRELIDDVTVVLRVNPYYYFEKWERTGDKTHIVFKNHSNEQKIDQSFTVTRSDNQVEIVYDGGIKKRTVLLVEPRGQGTRVTLSDDYSHLSKNEQKERIDEVDKSLKAWGEALFAYFVRIKRWSWVPLWRAYMRRFWVPMKPSARRIVWLLYLITLAEFGFFLFVLLIYVIEQST